MLDEGEVAVSPIPKAELLHGLLPKGQALGLPRRVAAQCPPTEPDE
ncbi:hypothetical protein ACFQY7_50290 [Actinomadura luteofluorescens]